VEPTRLVVCLLLLVCGNACDALLSFYFCVLVMLVGHRDPFFCAFGARYTHLSGCFWFRRFWCLLVVAVCAGCVFACAQSFLECVFMVLARGCSYVFCASRVNGVHLRAVFGSDVFLRLFAVVDLLQLVLTRIQMS